MTKNTVSGNFGLERTNKLECLTLARLLRPFEHLLAETRAYNYLKCFTQAGFSHILDKFDGLAMDKHTSLFVQCISD
jgi:hypothetical protein